MLLFSAACGRAAAPGQSAAPIQTRPFEPEAVRIGVEDLPPPFHTRSARNSPRVVGVPEDPVLEAPAGFSVGVYADNVPSARWLALTPGGDVLCACSRENRVLLFRDADGDGVAEERHVFLDRDTGADLPFGMAFANGHFYLGNSGQVLRYRYQEGDARVEGGGEQVTDLPGRGYHQHWTRNVVVGPDGETLFVSVGSASNVNVEPPPRAAVLRMKLDGSERSVFASGLRNPVGLDFHPQTGELYATVNERDGLGDDLVPDFLTRLGEGEFYGWPYAYLAPRNLDPRRMRNGRSERPELAARTRTPDVLFQSHSAALGLAFYDRDAFPARYRGGAFVAFRGSWNRDRGTGYKIVFVPFRDGRPTGSYEDFVRGFLLDPAGPVTWGRPVGVLTAPDGSLLFTEEANGRIYRVRYRQ